MTWLPRLLSARTKNTAQNCPPVSLAIEDYSLRLALADLELLLGAVDEQSVYVKLGELQPRVFQTVILHLEVENNTMVLDAFYPHLHAAEFCAAGIFTLEVAGSQRKLALQCLPLGIAPTDSRAYLVKILTQVKPEPVPEPLKFDANPAPLARLLIPLHGMVSGSLVEINTASCVIAVNGHLSSALRGSDGHCRVAFDQAFTLQTSVNVRQVQRLRKPHLHTRISLQLNHSDTHQAEQLAAFIRLVRGVSV